MALRGLILLAVLGLGSGADNFKFTDCKKMPDGVTAKDPMKSSAYQMSAGAPNNGSIEVTVTTGTLKFFRIVAMEDQKDTMPKGMFMLPADAKAMLMSCGAMTNAAVVNKEPADNVTAPFAVMWKAMPDYEGKVMFKLMVVEAADKYYMAESGAQMIVKAMLSLGHNLPIS
ncbi:hypothetical protein MTO96_015722 [Rhipicephalus appendiculatus]